MDDIVKKIYDYSLEEIMGERFGKYSKYIIQDRAIPDVRDGLKPVQRRILFSMYKEKNTFDKAYKKSARAVGDVMGKYHPHGDSSIYEAIVRMSQDWKMRAPFVDMQGNNGSVDGDSAAASRYTEARLSKIANEMLRDIEKDTVIFSPNYDDTLMEPTVLPCKFPNLLVNGTTGISAGYATNIPPHNLCEVIDGVIHRIDNPNSTLDDIMNFIKGPDFPLGAIASDINGIRSAYEMGRGRILISSKCTIEKNKIIVKEIPYEVNKAALVRKMDEIRIDKKIDGILSVIDESDKTGMQITIEVKKEFDANNILNYLYKNTDLQVSYNFNMIAIVGRRPKLLGLLEILDAYILHQREVTLKRSRFDLEHAKSRYHIVMGLIKALGILDEVIKTIRSSNNKSDAIINLVNNYEFSNLQATAIVELQLYRLTNTDVGVLLEEKSNLEKIMKLLEEVLSSDDKLNMVIKEELRRIRRDYYMPRKTEIRNEAIDIKIDNSVFIPNEDVIVVLSHDGYIKRVSSRSYSSSEEETSLKDNDYVLSIYKANTKSILLIFTNLGNYLYLPVYEIPEFKWKELGKHISNIVSLSSEEVVVASVLVDDFEKDSFITSFSKMGMVKRTKLSLFNVQRYSKTISMMNLKDGDEVVSVSSSNSLNCFIATYKGYGLWFDISEVSPIGIKGSGVKAIDLRDDEVVSAMLFDWCEHISIITDKGTGKRLKISELEKSTRAKRGRELMKEIKSNPSHILSVYFLSSQDEVVLVTDKESKLIRYTDIQIMDKQSNGSYLVRDGLLYSYKKAKL